MQTNPARTSLLTGEIAFSAGEIMQEAGVGVSKRVRLINRDGILEIQHVPTAMIRCLDIISSQLQGGGVMSEEDKKALGQTIEMAASLAVSADSSDLHKTTTYRCRNPGEIALFQQLEERMCRGDQKSSRKLVLSVYALLGMGNIILDEQRKNADLQLLLGQAQARLADAPPPAPPPLPPPPQQYELTDYQREIIRLGIISEGNDQMTALLEDAVQGRDLHYMGMKHTTIEEAMEGALKFDIEAEFDANLKPLYEVCLKLLSKARSPAGDDDDEEEDDAQSYSDDAKINAKRLTLQIVNLASPRQKIMVSW